MKCYQSHDGPCRPDTTIVVPNETTETEVHTVNTASTVDQTPAVTAPSVADQVAQLEARVAELTAANAAKESRFVDYKGRMATTERNLRWAQEDLTNSINREDKLRDKLALNGDTRSQLEHAQFAVAQLLLSNLDVAAIAHQQADRADMAQARCLRLADALVVAHDFAREVYGSPTTDRRTQGEAAIAIVELGDALVGGAI